MTREEKVKYWIELSDEDFRVAEGLLKLRHFLYVAFMCHQRNYGIVCKSLIIETKEMQQWTKENILLIK